MNNDLDTVLARHNSQQRGYFERTLKRTMVPRRSAYLMRQAREMVRCIELTRADRVLEVGCGMGRYTLPLAELGYRIEGLDLSAGLLDRLRGFNGGRFDIPLYAGDVISCSSDLERAFDAVIGFFVLHHLHDLDRCWQAMARLLKPGGRIAFIEPNPLNPAYYVQILVTPRMTWRGERGLLQMRPRRIFTAMRRAGLVNQFVRRFGLFPPVLADRRLGRALEAAGERVLSRTPLLAFQVFGAARPPRSA